MSSAGVPPPARVALVGFGLGGSVFHAPLIDSEPGLSLDGIVTSDPGRQAQARAGYPQARLMPAVEDLLRVPEDWDLVVVTVPNARHLDVAEAVVRAGLPVVVDKPVTPTSSEALRLASAARERGVNVIPYHNRRWDGDFLTVRDLVASGRVGEVWRFESRFERWRPKPAQPGSWKMDPKQAANGVIYDLGTHLIDQALVLFGRPAHVYAERRGHTAAVDDDSFIALDYPNGPAVHLWTSSTAADLGPRFRVLGSQAAYVKYGLDPQEAALKSGARPGGLGWGEERPEEWGRLGTADDPEGTEAVPTRAGDYPAFYAGVAAHLAGQAPPPVPITDAITGLEVIEAAFESARSGSVVSM